MTTLIGLKAGKGKKGIILASDLSGTQTSWSAEGDVAYRQQTRLEMQKIYVDKKREVALCTSGMVDQSYVDFLSNILEGNIDVRKVTEERFFPELRDLNLHRWEGRIPISNVGNSLLMATRFNDPILYTCWPLGKVEERAWTSIGSGSEYALNYLSKQDTLIPKGLSLKKGIDLIVDSLDEAAKDIYTEGLDMVVATRDGIQEFGKDIRNAMTSAKKGMIRKIKEDLN